MSIDPSLARLLVRMPLHSIHREYPNKLDHVINGPEDLLSPKQLHPAFYGCFDWHSAVHGHWALISLLKLGAVDNEAEVRAALRVTLTEQNLATELAYLHQPGRRGFERTYGWAWLLKLALELRTWDDRDGADWAKWIQPLADVFADWYLDYLPKLTYPIRVGTHANTAFGLNFALEYAEPGSELHGLIKTRAMGYFADDEMASVATEPGGADFLSPSLMEAELMRKVLTPSEFASWFDRFIGDGDWSPAYVSDRSDGQIAHLDGLNLSRAWCLYGVASALPHSHPRRDALLATAAEHQRSALSNLDTGHYEGEHWLGSFALLMLRAQL